MGKPGPKDTVLTWPSQTMSSTSFLRLWRSVCQFMMESTACLVQAAIFCATGPAGFDCIGSIMLVHPLDPRGIGPDWLYDLIIT